MGKECCSWGGTKYELAPKTPAWEATCFKALFYSDLSQTQVPSVISLSVKDPLKSHYKDV